MLELCHRTALWVASGKLTVLEKVRFTRLLEDGTEGTPDRNGIE